MSKRMPTPVRHRANRFSRRTCPQGRRCVIAAPAVALARFGLTIPGALLLRADVVIK